MVETSQWLRQQGLAVLDQLNEMIKKKILKGFAEALESKDLSPYEVLADEALEMPDKLILCLGSMPDYMLCSFIDDLIRVIFITSEAPAHTFGYKVNRKILDLLSVIRQYAREELSARELGDYLLAHEIVKNRPEEIDPSSITKIVVVLFRTIAELNAHHDVDFYSETDEHGAYMDEVNNRVNEMLYFLVRSTYKNALH